MNIKVRIRLKAIKPFGTMQTGEIMTLWNEPFDRLNGVAFYPIDLLQWEVISTDLFTGAKDKCINRDVYESDICHFTTKENGQYINHSGEVKLINYKWVLETKHKYYEIDLNCLDIIEVLGNTHNAPHLLTQPSNQ